MLDESTLENFILNGNWPGWEGGEKIILSADSYARIINVYIQRVGAIYKFLPFKPIGGLVNCKDSEESYELQTDVKIISFKEGLNLGTHCHVIYSSFLDFSNKSEVKQLLITREKEWVIWTGKFQNCESISYKKISLSAEFKKIKDIKEFLVGFKGPYCCFVEIIQNIARWYMEDVEYQLRRIEKKREEAIFLEGMLSRAKQVK